MNIKESLLRHKIIAIIRGAKPNDVMAIVKALQAGGIAAVEVTLNSDNALGLISELTATAGNALLVGAGTVLNAADAIAAMEAGAQFVISPSLDIETIGVTKAQGRISIPGAYTATEIVKAHEAGADIIKIFPASSPQYIKDLRGPLSHISLMPTGGVNLDNIKAFQQAGAIAFGIGSSLVDSKEKVDTAYLQRLTQRAAAFVAAIAN